MHSCQGGADLNLTPPNLQLDWGKEQNISAFVPFQLNSGGSYGKQLAQINALLTQVGSL